MDAGDTQNKWDGSRWAALRVLLHGLLIPTLEEWADIKQGLTTWRRALYVRPPLPIPAADETGPHRRTVGRIAQARTDCWPLVDPQAEADMVRNASLFPGQSFSASEYVWFVRQGGWDLTPRRGVPILKRLESEGYLSGAPRRRYMWETSCHPPQALETPEVHFSRFLNDLGLVLPQRFSQVPGAKLWMMGAHLPPQRFATLASDMFGAICDTLAEEARPSDQNDGPTPRGRIALRFSALATQDPSGQAVAAPTSTALTTLLATIGGEFGRQIGDFGRADEVLQRELIESLAQRAQSEGYPLLQMLKERWGIGTWRTLDRWRNQRSMAEIEASTKNRGMTWAEGWILEELAANWPSGLSANELLRGLERAYGHPRVVEQKSLGALLGSLLKRGLIKRKGDTPSKLVIGQPDRFVPVSQLAVMEQNMITSLEPLARSLGAPGEWGVNRVAQSGMWIVERRDLERLTERIRERIEATMNESQRSTEHRDHDLDLQPKRAAAARIFMLLRPSPLL